MVRSKTVQEVFSELAFIRGFRDVQVRGENEPRRGGPRPHSSPQRVVLPLLEEPQELYLGLRGKVSDLIQGGVPPFRLRDHPFPCRVGSRVGALDVPEQGVGEQECRRGRPRSRARSCRLPAAHRVDGPRHQLLAPSPDLL